MRLQVDVTADDPVIRKLCADYWEMDARGFVHRTTDLEPPAGVRRHLLHSFIAQHCSVRDPQIVCQKCGTEAVLTSRTDYDLKRKHPWICDACRNAQQEERRLQEHSTESARVDALADKRRRIRQTYSHLQPQFLSMNDLSFENAVALLALLRLGASEDLSSVGPVGNLLLSPTSDLTSELLRSLHHSGLIAVDPESSLDAFQDDVDTFYLYKVAWLPPVDEHGDPWKVMYDLENALRGGTWPHQWYEEAFGFWRRVALHECLQYLNVCMLEHGFQFNPAEKTRAVFLSILDDYSPGQIYKFIWRAVKDAAAYYMRDRVTKDHAANSAVGRIQRSADYALANGWLVEPYRRDRRAPESELSAVLYSVALSLQGDGISSVPKRVRWSFKTAVQQELDED